MNGLYDVIVEQLVDIDGPNEVEMIESEVFHSDEPIRVWKFIV